MRTKKARIVLLLVSAVLILLAAHQVAAQDVVPGQYTGKTSQGFPMGLTVVPGPMIQNFGFVFDLHCQISGKTVNVGMGFFGFNVPIKDGKFEFQFESLAFVFSMDGTVFPGVGLFGAVDTKWAAVVKARGVYAELCMSSPPGKEKVQWVAVPDVGIPSEAALPAEGDIMISLTRDPETGLVSEVFVK